jgi:hypothetical protein
MFSFLSNSNKLLFVLSYEIIFIHKRTQVEFWFSLVKLVKALHAGLCLTLFLFMCVSADVLSLLGTLSARWTEGELALFQHLVNELRRESRGQVLGSLAAASSELFEVFLILLVHKIIIINSLIVHNCQNKKIKGAKNGNVSGIVLMTAPFLSICIWFLNCFVHDSFRSFSKQKIDLKSIISCKKMTLFNWKHLPNPF